MGSVANKVNLGDLIEAAEEGGLANDAVSLEHLDDGILPSHVAKFAGEATTAGGAAAEAITVTGLEATDIVTVSLVDDGPNNVSIASIAATANTLTVTFSGDPGAGAKVNYIAVRAAS